MHGERLDNAASQSASPPSARALQFLPDPAERFAFVALQYDLDNTLYGGSPPPGGSVSLARWLVPSEAPVAALLAPRACRLTSTAPGPWPATVGAMSDEVEVSVITCALGRDRRRWTAAGTAAGVLTFWMVATLGRPWNVFRRGLITSDWYDMQAHRLLSGHFSVPAAMTGLDGIATAHGNQMYFGVFPAVLRMPIIALTSTFDGRLGVLSELIAVAVLGIAVARIARKAEIAVQSTRVVAQADAPSYAYALVACVAIAATQVLFLAAGSWIYFEAVAWGIAGAVLGLDAVLTWWQTRRGAHLAWAVVAASLAFASRPSTGVAPTLTLGLFAAVLFRRREWRTAAQAVGAAIASFGTYAAVNFVRFGQWFGVNFEHQVATSALASQKAAVAATGGTLMSPGYIFSTASRYLNPWPGLIRLTRLFPFVQWGPSPRAVHAPSPMFLEPSVSLPLSAPLVTTLALVGAVWFVRRRPAVEWWVAVIAGVGAAVPSMIFWSITQRYLVDLLVVSVVLAAPGCWVALGWWRLRSTRVRHVVAVAAIAVSLSAAWAQAGLAMWTRHFSYLPAPAEQVAFVRFQYSLDDALFPGRPPGVHQVALDATPSPSSHVVIVGWCAGTYIRSVDRWTVIERQPGAGRRSVLIPDEATRTAMRSTTVQVASGAGWQVETHPGSASGTAAIEYHAGAMVVRGIAPIDLTTDVVLDLVADPLTDEVTVAQGTAPKLLVYVAPGADRLTAAPGWSGLKGPAPFCYSLLRRGVVKG